MTICFVAISFISYLSVCLYLLCGEIKLHIYLDLPSINYCSVELSGKSIPIHFVLDAGPATVASTCKSARDSYVVVPGNALFADLVHIVLTRIGFTPVDSLAAKGNMHFNPLSK